MYGRIRVVVAEGVIGPDTMTISKPKFDRLRDIVGFSFQHAPKRL